MSKRPENTGLSYTYERRLQKHLSHYRKYKNVLYTFQGKLLKRLCTSNL